MNQLTATSRHGDMHQSASLSTTRTTAEKVWACMTAADDSPDFAAAAELFAAVYGSRRWERGEWAAFLEAEGLRVKDLDPQLGRERLRALGRALVSAGLSQASAAAVLGISQSWFSKLVKDSAGTSTDGLVAKDEPVALLGSGRSSQGYRQAVVAAVVAEGIAEDPPVPEDSLRLAVTSIADGSRFVEEYLEGMGSGSVLGVKDEALIRRLTRELQALIGMLPETGAGLVRVNE